MGEEGPIDKLLASKKRQIATGERNLETDIWFGLLDLDGLNLEKLIHNEIVISLFADTPMAKKTSSASYPDLTAAIEKMNRENQDMSFSPIMEEGVGGPVCTGVRIDRIRDGSHVDGENGPMDMLLWEKYRQIDTEQRIFSTAMSFALLNLEGCHLTSLAKYRRADIPFGELGYSEYALRRLRPLLPAYVKYLNDMNPNTRFSLVEGEAGGMKHTAIWIIEI